MSAVVSLATSETGDLHSGSLFCDLPMRASLCHFKQILGAHLLGAACLFCFLTNVVFKRCSAASVFSGYKLSSRFL